MQIGGVVLAGALLWLALRGLHWSALREALATHPLPDSDDEVLEYLDAVKARALDAPVEAAP